MSRRLRIAIIGTLDVVLPVAGSAAQSSQPLSKDVVAARIDSMARARLVMGPVGMSVAVSRGSGGVEPGAARGTGALASYTAMTTPRAAPGGPPVNGWGIQVHNSPPWGIRTIWLLSGGAGFAAENAWFPAESLSVTVLYNSFGGPTGPPLALGIAQLLSPAASVQQPTQPPSAAATARTPR